MESWTGKSVGGIMSHGASGQQIQALHGPIPHPPQRWLEAWKNCIDLIVLPFHTKNKQPVPLPPFCGIMRQQRMYSFGHVWTETEVIIDSFKHCTLTITTDGNEDLLIHCLKRNQHCAAGLDWLKRLHYIVLQKRQDPFVTMHTLFYYCNEKTWP